MTLPMNFRQLGTLAFAVLLVTHAPETAHAAAATWTGSSDALWATPGNWSASPVPGMDDTATFNNAGGSVDVVSLAGITVHTIRFDTSAAAYTFGSGAVNSESLTLNNGGAITLNAGTANNQLINAAILLGTDGSARTFTITNNTAARILTLAGSVTGSAGAGIKTIALAGSGPVIFNGAISNGSSGTVKLTKGGAGTLALSATASTFSGGTVIDAASGTVTAKSTNATNATGLGSGAVSVGANSTLNLLSVNTVNTPTTINNTFTGTGKLKLTFTDTIAATYTVLGGVGGFTGTIQLSNTTSSNKDKWYANNIGTLNAALVIDNASQIFVAGGPASFTSISVTGTGNAEGYGAIRLGNTLGGNITLAGNTTIGLGGGTITGNISSGAAGIQTLTLGTTSAASTGTFNGSIGGGTGTIALAAASGTSNLNGANTHTGNTLINGGTLVIGHNLALQNSVLDTSGAGTLAFAAGIQSPVFGGLSGTRNLTTSSGVTGVTLNTPASVTATYAGVLGSATPGMSLTKTGPGTQVLSGAHVFSGPTLVSQGTLRIAANPTFPAGLKIMPLGDSITNGSGVATNYRYYLHGLLSAVAPGFQFVGDSTDNSTSMPVSPVDQRFHAGHSSYACNDISNNLDGLDTAVFTQYGGTSRDPHGGYWFTGGNGTGRDPIYPDAILLLCAANDISRVGMTGVQGRIEALLTKITTLRPDARVFLAKGSPYSGFSSQVATFNGIIDTVAADFQAAGKKITVVDLNTGYPAGQFVDSVHPNATGYYWMANRWFDALASVYATGGGGPNSMALATTSSVTVEAAARLEGAGQIGGPLTVYGTYGCDTSGTLAVTGDLTLSNATLAITFPEASAASYTIASYTGTRFGAFTTVTGLPAGYTVHYDDAAKRILLATHYEAWRLSKGLDETNDSMQLDPDGDGASNLLEFALGGNPLVPGDRGVSRGMVQDLAGSPAMTLTIAARAGATFVSNGNQTMSATRDGISYQIEGSQELTTWTGGIAELIPALTSGLPPAPGGHEYHTFQSTTPVAGNARDFLRVKVTAAP